MGDAPALPDEVETLLARWGKRDSRLQARVASEVLSLPGVGVCVPDLVFEDPSTGERVFLEVLGFWRRAAVFQRAELVQAGLRDPVLFAVPSRLRVSEEVLPLDLPGALYVYKGSLLPGAVETRLEELLARSKNRL